MNDQSPPINPYAPPTTVVTAAVRHDSYLWRDGDRLVIRMGAKLPPYCMVTGGPAPYSHPFTQFWHPRWVYMLLLFAVVPYLLLAPFLRKRVDLEVPFGNTLYRRHQRRVNRGIVMMLTGGLMVIGFAASAVGQWISEQIAILLVVGVFLCLAGLQIASSLPMRLNITKVENDLVFVDDIHPDYLNRLPDIHNPMPVDSEAFANLSAQLQN